MNRHPAQLKCHPEHSEGSAFGFLTATKSRSFAEFTLERSEGLRMT